MNTSVSVGARVAVKLLVALVLLVAPSLRADATLIAVNAEWRYGVPEDAAVNATWRDEFNDSNWRVGPAQLGYGDGDEATLIPDHPPVVLFRKRFNVDAPSAFSKLIFRLLRDDGAVVYLNGTEVFRSNMPDGAISPQTMALTAVGAEDEARFFPYDVSALNLRAGENVVAVELHQVNVSSTDLSFALELIGVTDATPRPVVSIVATRSETREPDPLSRVASGLFTIKRTGSLDSALPVFLQYRGTAEPGRDCGTLPMRVDFAAGQETKLVEVGAINDFLKEPTETVVAKIIPPPTSPDIIPYEIAADAGSATVSIFDCRSGIEITSPASGASFKQGTTITIQAVALAVDGTIPSVRFYAGDTLIGTSTPIFIQAPEPGQPINHGIEWKNAPLGEYVIQARGAVDSLAGGGQIYTSQSIVVRVVPNSEVPVLSVETKWPTTSEPLPNALVTPGLFVVHRSGRTDTEFNAWYVLGGTAKEGIDYDELPDFVHFAPGQVDAEIKILPKSDDLVEGDETVVVELTEPPTMGAVAWYTIDPTKNRSVVTIKDEDQPARARIEITKPTEGAALLEGSTVTIEATAVDPNGYLPRVEFFVDGQSIGVSEIVFITAPDPGTPIHHSIEWKNVAIGDHTITAVAVRPDGTKVESAPRHVHVVRGDPPPMSIVSIRTIPDPTDGPIPNADYAADFFEIRRTMPTNADLRVYYRVVRDGEHMATPGADYVELPGGVTIPAGQFATNVRVQALDDTLVEGPEIVRLELLLVPTTADRAYNVDPEHRTADVVIQDNDEPAGQVVLAVEVVDGVASEVRVTTVLDTATFAIKRVGGPTDVAVTARYEMSGTAANGVDYEKLSGTVELPAGVARAVVKVSAIPDNLEEGEETVVLTLMPSVCPIAAGTIPPPECYLVGDAKSGRAVIVDRRNEAPSVKILHPVNGSVFALGQIIEIEAQAWDREGSIAKLEILLDGHVLDTTPEDHIVVQWSQAGLGDHVIVARATDEAGQVARAEIKILVREANADAFVFRRLPPAYTPGTSFVVELRAEPPAGARAYAVEDQPPTGWAVSEISHEGRFDSATGKVKFGPFTDTTARTLTYRLTPPAGATGLKEFTGVGSIDGVNYRIGGDRLISPGATYHPADTNSDFRITVNELTAYAALWKSGGDIPLSYVTRAGFIWRNGETYRCDASIEPPRCWIPTQTPPPEPGVAAAATPTVTERVGSSETAPGVSTTIQLKIAPPAGTAAYAVEEKVPAGWSVGNVSNEGTFDSASGVIRWGMFLDGTARTLSYTLTPPPVVSAIAKLDGRVSFDGAVQEVYGSSGVTSSGDTSLPTLTKCEADASGKV
ncbi:MAG TPA: Ig-like domain-containing protein, partial [Verrucomicrobiae bacterium]|nr:Ig-like domain-containing protein [Verrucomicrobiae bacterium]